jgi:hypothetical protein
MSAFFKPGARFRRMNLSFKGKTTWLSRCSGGDRREVSRNLTRHLWTIVFRIAIPRTFRTSRLHFLRISLQLIEEQWHGALLVLRGSGTESIPSPDPPLSLALFFATSHALAMSKILSALFPQGLTIGARSVSRAALDLRQGEST